VWHGFFGHKWLAANAVGRASNAVKDSTCTYSIASIGQVEFGAAVAVGCRAASAFGGRCESGCDLALGAGANND